MKKHAPKTAPSSLQCWLRKRWLLLALPFVVFAGLIALAPTAPDRPENERMDQDGATHRSRAGKSFNYIPDDEVFALELDPRRVRFGLLEGWDREDDAFEDISALAYVSGPMYERHVDAAGQELTVPLGDLKFGAKVWMGRNRAASRQRAFIGIQKDGSVDFGYGELTDARSTTYDTFIGGLHSLYNDLEDPPDTYKGAYSISMGQRIRYYLPRIRMVMGIREDGHLEILMSRDGLTLEQTKDLARRRGYLAAYMPDHASKSRFIIPGTKGFTEEDANWISGGATSFVHVPYMLRLSPRQRWLRGDLVAGLTPKLIEQQSCDGLVDCVQLVGGHLADRALAGLNRVMEQGVEPLARMIWAPSPHSKPSKGRDESAAPMNPDRSPLREPPITADPLVLREQPSIDRDAPSPDLSGDQIWDRSDPFLPLPPDLPPPIVLDESIEADTSDKDDPVQGEPRLDFDLDDGLDDGLNDAPPPPELPPLDLAPLQPLPSMAE